MAGRRSAEPVLETADSTYTGTHELWCSRSAGRPALVGCALPMVRRPATGRKRSSVNSNVDPEEHGPTDKVLCAALRHCAYAAFSCGKSCRWRYSVSEARWRGQTGDPFIRIWASLAHFSRRAHSSGSNPRSHAAWNTWRYRCRLVQTVRGSVCHTCGRWRCHALGEASPVSIHWHRSWARSVLE